MKLESDKPLGHWGIITISNTALSVHHWVARLGVEPNQVNDLVQEVFVVQLDRISRFAEHPPDSFRARLRMVTVNKCLDHFRPCRRDLIRQSRT